MCNNDKLKYRDYSKNISNLPLFHKDWWLDAVCGEENWNAVVIESNDVVQALFPYYRIKKAGLMIITRPMLTPFSGPWLNYPVDQKYFNRVSFEMDVMKQIIDKLPDFDSFKQTFHPGIVNWLPFYWKNYHQTTRYTYRIEYKNDIELYFNELRGTIRTRLKKAEKILSLKEEYNIDELYRQSKMTFDRQSTRIPFSKEFLQAIHQACLENNCVKIISAIDSEQRVHGSLMLVWDSSYVYYLVAGNDTELRNSGAQSFLIWEGIRLSYELGLGFDFEGSIIEPVETFFRPFGGKLTPYFAISKTNSLLFTLLVSLMNKFKFLKNIK